jgi:hypothetical protein
MTETITTSDADYAFEIVKTICKEVGPGIAGSSQERERAAILKRELEAHLGVGNVAVEEFTLAPKGFLNPYPGVVLMILAALLNISMGRLPGISPWLTAAAALVFSLLAPLLFVLEFVLGFEVIDPFCRKKKSVNVIGTLRNPQTKNVKRVLLLGGHHDSAPENTWLRFLGYGFFIFSGIFLIGTITMLVVSILQLTGVVLGNDGIVRAGTLGWVLLAFPIAPSIVFLLFQNRGWKNGGNVPGAVDNLSASAVVVALCRFLVKNSSFIPADTEIRFVSFGSEEVGLRGSRRYVARHLDELKILEARLLNFEMIAYPEIGILTGDGNGTLKNPPELVKGAIAAAERAGVPYRVSPATFGTNTDAASFTKAGLKALTLFPFKFPQQTVAFYHTNRDQPGVMTIEPLFNVLKLALEWVNSSGE